MFAKFEGMGLGGDVVTIGLSASLMKSVPLFLYLDARVAL